jgi:hypothetical protein
MFVKMLTHSHLRLYTYGVGTFEDLIDGFALWWILVSNSALIQSVLGQAFSWDG